MIAVKREIATRTSEYPIRQSELRKQAIPTPIASLRSVGRINSNEGVASLCRFATHHTEKARPGRVHYAFGKTVILAHAVDMQIFHCYQPELIYDFAAVLMREVSSFETNTLMHSGDYLAPLFTQGRTLFGLTKFLLSASQRL